MLRPYSFGSRSPRPGLALSPCNDSGSSCSWRGSELDRAPPRREHPSASAPGRCVIAAARASAPPRSRPQRASRLSISPLTSRDRSRHYRAVCGRVGATARLSGLYGPTGAATAFVLLFATPTIALELAGGSYLRDPYQGLPRAGFVTLGVRLHTSPRLPRADPSAARWSPLVPQLRGDSLVVRFRFDSVRAVAIAGDWNQWQPVPLRSLGASLWEGTLALKRGLYHFNLLVDGSDWVVPTGVATVPDGLGGMVGVLLVP